MQSNTPTGFSRKGERRQIRVNPRLPGIKIRRASPELLPSFGLKPLEVPGFSLPPAEAGGN